MIGERIRRARKAAGLSLRDLADGAGVSHTTLSKFERALQTPNSGQLLAIARVLGIRSEYLLRPTVIRLGEVAYRANRLPAKVRDRVHADVLDQLERWHELLALFPEEALPPFRLPEELPTSINDYSTIEHVADRVRMEWRLGCDSIPDVIDTLESFGIIVVQTNIGESAGFNGLSASAGDELTRPVIVVDAAWPGDRQRFTAAHELGHLVLDGRLAEHLDIEQACNRFAGAFLFPDYAVVQTLGKRRQMLEPKELAILKAEFGLSMQASLYRARDAGVITEATHKTLFRQFVARGWRKREPGDPCPSERTVRFRQLVYHALAENFIGESKAAELLNMPVGHFHRERQMEGTDADSRQ